MSTLDWTSRPVSASQHIAAAAAAATVAMPV